MDKAEYKTIIVDNEEKEVVVLTSEDQTEDQIKK
tara:strand:- start:1052 stop:1153 length:102 start_codon:yes stop_codon:yes gene_type:complete